MPEPHHRCADPSCHQTLAAHEDPHVFTCSAFKVPAFGGAFDDLAQARRTVGQDGGKPIQVVHYSDARRCITLAHEAGRAEADATHAEALECWGAFDYELLLMAEEAGVPSDGLSPLQLVRALIGAGQDRALRLRSGGDVRRG